MEYVSSPSGGPDLPSIPSLDLAKSYVARIDALEKEVRHARLLTRLPSYASARRAAAAAKHEGGEACTPSDLHPVSPSHPGFGSPEAPPTDLSVISEVDGEGMGCGAEAAELAVEEEYFYAEMAAHA
jgi:kinesin family protein 4/21/27